MRGFLHTFTVALMMLGLVVPPPPSSVAAPPSVEADCCCDHTDPLACACDHGASPASSACPADACLCLHAPGLTAVAALSVLAPLRSITPERILAEGADPLSMRLDPPPVPPPIIA
jgi:hypothetical protein